MHKKSKQAFKYFFSMRTILFLNKIKKEIIRTGAIAFVVLASMWGIVKATEDELARADQNFSAIGEISLVSNETISMINARGTDISEEELYNFDITYLDKIETKDYEPLIITDIRPGDMIIAQGVTDGKKIFIKRIVSFSSIATTTQETLNATSTLEIATTTSEQTATTTEDASEDSEVNEDSSSETSQATTTDEDSNQVEQNLGENSVDQNNASTTVGEDEQESLLEEVLDGASELLDNVIDTLTGSEDVEIEEFDEVIDEESVEDEDGGDVQEGIPVEAVVDEPVVEEEIVEEETVEVIEEVPVEDISQE